MENKEIDLNAPAFIEEEQEETNQPQEEKKEEVSGSTEEEPVGDKPRVPYSRFEKVHEEKIRAEEQARIYKEQLDKAQIQPEEPVQLPKDWLELYGDTPQSVNLYKLEQDRLQRIEEETTQRAIEALDKRQQESEKASEKNLEYIENSLGEFKESLGRSLTDEEESGILDIQDEFTPKGEDGKYVSELLDPAKAYEIYTLRQQGSKNSKSQARRRVVSLTGANSESSAEESNNWDGWRPGETGVWRKRLNN